MPIKGFSQFAVIVSTTIKTLVREGTHELLFYPQLNSLKLSRLVCIKVLDVTVVVQPVRHMHVGDETATEMSRKPSPRGAGR